MMDTETQMEQKMKPVLLPEMDEPDQVEPSADGSLRTVCRVSSMRASPRMRLLLMMGRWADKGLQMGLMLLTTGLRRLGMVLSSKMRPWMRTRRREKRRDLLSPGLFSSSVGLSAAAKVDRLTGLMMPEEQGVGPESRPEMKLLPEMKLRQSTEVGSVSRTGLRMGLSTKRMRLRMSRALRHAKTVGCGRGSAVAGGHHQ
jgi:hypothetical protein